MSATRLCTGLFLFSTFFWVSSAAGDGNETTSHVVVTSSAIVPNNEFAVFVQLDHPMLTQEEDPNLIISVDIQDLISFQSIWTLDLKQNVTSVHSRTFQVLIPSDQKLLKKNYKVMLKSKGLVMFDYEAYLPVKWKSILITITPDKLRYKPGDTVELLISALRDDLKPFSGPLNITIYTDFLDSRQLLRWDEEIPSNGVIRKSYRLPLVQKPGKLIISVENHDQVVNQTIHVEERDFKAFKVQLLAPRYQDFIEYPFILNENFSISILANHFSGAPLYGTADVIVRIQPDKNWVHFGSVDIQQGYAKVSVIPDQLKKLIQSQGNEGLVGRTLALSVRVFVLPSLIRHIQVLRERVLGQVEEEVQTTFLTKHKDLTFHWFNPKSFKPGQVFVGYVELRSVKEFEFKSHVGKYLHMGLINASGHHLTFTNVSMTPNSITQFNFRVPSDVIGINLRILPVLYANEESEKGNVPSSLEIQLFKTKEGNKLSIQILLDQERPMVKIGHSLKVKIESTFPTERLTYNVVSEALLVLSGEICSLKPESTHQFSLNIPKNVSHKMSTSRLIVWTQTPGHEIVADSILFVVDHEEENQKVTIRVSSHSLNVGGQLEVTVEAEPHSEVRAFVLEDMPVFDSNHSEVSKRIGLEKMKRKMMRLKNTYVSYLLKSRCPHCTTIPASSIDPANIFEEAEALIFTDAKFYQAKVQLDLKNNGTWGSLESQLDSLDSLNPAFWRAFTMNSTGKASFMFDDFYKAGVFTFSAIAITPGNKVVVSEEPIQVVVGSRVIGSISHPEEIIRGEEFLVEVTIFNNRKIEAEINASIADNVGMKLLCQESKIQNVKIGPLQEATVQFFVKSTIEASREMLIEVNLRSYNIQQHLESTVRVTFEGMEVRDEKTWVLDNFQGNQLLDIHVKQPIEKVIINTEQAEVKIYGDLLGPVIERVCREGQSPTLLEDRTKLNFVQTLHVIRRLSNNLNFENDPNTGGSIMERKEINGSFNVQVHRKKCIKSGLESIQNLLNKQYPDGSYSFHHGSAGYLWLTSMMLDSMLDLAEVQPRYKDEAGRASRWLMNRQKNDGSYVEEEGVPSLKVHNLKDIPLTSQVMCSLIRAKEYLPLETQDVKLIEASVSKSTKFLEEALANIEVTNDSYVLAIGSYALVLARSEKVHEVLKKRDKLVIEEDGTLHWRVAEYGDNSSLNIEATAYAALTYLEMGGLHESRPIINWLISQMTYEGAFVYVEDTSIALRALTMYSRLLQEQHGHQSINVDVELTASNDEKTALKIVHPLFAGSISFDHTNMSLGCPLKIETSGSGLILIQSITRYNTPIPSENSERVSLSVDTKNVGSHLEVKVCTGSLKHFESGFSVVEVPFLSSYEFNLKRNKERNDKVESYQIFADDRTSWIIIDKLSPEPLCLDLEFEQVNIIGHRQPRPIRSYALIEPSKAAVKLYADVNKEDEDKVCPW